jgi:hypothetical protein
MSRAKKHSPREATKRFKGNEPVLSTECTDVFDLVDSSYNNAIAVMDGAEFRSNIHA